VFISKGAMIFSPDKEQVPAPKVGLKIEGIVAGRGFHWQKELTEIFLGTLEFFPVNDVLVVVNVVGIEFYTICALASEMSGVNTLPASGCAQATAARSWAYVFLKSKYTDKPYQICNDDFSQRYQGTTHLDQKVIDLVSASRGDYIVLPDGSVAPSNYSKSCGGHTEATLDLFGYDAGHPETFFDTKDSLDDNFTDLTDEDTFKRWLKAPRDKYFCGLIPDKELKKYLGAVDDEGEYFRWNYTVSAETIIKKLAERCQIAGVKSIRELNFGKRAASGRYLELEIKFINQAGVEESILLADQFYIRACLHESFLFSSAFTHTELYDEAGNIMSVHFEGAGWGHGGGFCQIGAVGMALVGYSYSEIIKHYYPNAKIVKAY